MNTQTIEANKITELTKSQIKAIKKRWSYAPFAFVAVIDKETNEYRLGVAVANEQGYYALPDGWARHYSYEGMSSMADRLNVHELNLSLIDEAHPIIGSTMKGRPYHET